MPCFEPLAHLTYLQDPQAQEAIIAAVRSVAKSAENDFSPYFHDTIALMAQLMTQTDDKMLGLRSAATECVGAIACAVGKEKFAPFLPDAVKVRPPLRALLLPSR